MLLFIVLMVHSHIRVLCYSHLCQQHNHKMLHCNPCASLQTQCYILHIVNVTFCNITKFFSRLLEVAPPSCTSYTTAQALAIHTDFLTVGTHSVVSVRSIKFMCRQVLKFLNTAHSEPSQNSFLQIPIISGLVFWHYTLLFTYILPYCCNSE